MKTLLFILLILGYRGNAQKTDCAFGPPAVTIDFGSGVINDLNLNGSYAYRRIMGSCPSDGHYTFTSSTSDCFRGDWQSLPADHTGNGGNMMIVNASYRNGYFLTTKIAGLKPNTIYEFGVWMLNVCRLTDKCPFPLLPNINIQLRTMSGTVVGQLQTGEVARLIDPRWSQYKFVFTTPATTEDLMLTMIDDIPGGCGNDFALDDITFRECIKVPLSKTVTKKTPPKKPVAKAPGKTVAKVTAKPVAKEPAKPDTKKPAKPDTKVAAKPDANATVKPYANATVKPDAKISAKPVDKVAAKPMNKPIAKKPIPKQPSTILPDQPKAQSDSLPLTTAPVSGSAANLPRSIPLPSLEKPVIRERAKMAPPPAILLRRENEVYKKIQAPAGEIRIDLYDNGEIDGDTVTIYHNNKLVVSRERLTAQPITLRIAINPDEPYHEIVMVANNLGSIPPNTSLMVVHAGGTRYEVYTSANERKNAKVIFDLSTQRQ